MTDDHDHGLTAEPLTADRLSIDNDAGWAVLKAERRFRRMWGFWPKEYTTDPAELAEMPTHLQQAMDRYRQALEGR